MNHCIKKVILSIFCLFCLQSLSYAQYTYGNQAGNPRFYMGLGLGLGYGGAGAKFEYLPIKYLGLSAGVGYNLLGPGLNAGASFKALPNKKIQPVVNLLYGYNAVILIQDWDELSKTYYGFSAGLGVEFKLGKHHNKLSLSVYYPFRSQQLQDDYDAIKNNPALEVTDMLPIAYEIGFNWAI